MEAPYFVLDTILEIRQQSNPYSFLDSKTSSRMSLATLRLRRFGRIPTSLQSIATYWFQLLIGSRAGRGGVFKLRVVCRSTLFAASEETFRPKCASIRPTKLRSPSPAPGGIEPLAPDERLDPPRMFRAFCSSYSTKSFRLLQFRNFDCTNFFHDSAKSCLVPRT